MLKKLLSLVTPKSLAAPVAPAAPAAPADPPTGLHHPYGAAHVDMLYNLLFCDDIKLLALHTTGNASGPWPVLAAASPGEAALRSIADDAHQASRARAFAYNRLRAEGKDVPPNKLLGVIVEVHLEGLDVLAAFDDGSVRYLNQSGKVLVIESDAHPAAAAAKALLAASAPVVERMGPWEKQRLASPAPGQVRLTFLVSDGLYFGQGEHAALGTDAMAGPVLDAATALLTKVVETGLAAKASAGQVAPA